VDGLYVASGRVRQGGEDGLQRQGRGEDTEIFGIGGWDLH
jgi:hypothetical protein